MPFIAAPAGEFGAKTAFSDPTEAVDVAAGVDEVDGPIQEPARNVNKVNAVHTVSPAPNVARTLHDRRPFLCTDFVTRR